MASKKITNYQLNLIVDKIYQTLLPEIDRVREEKIKDYELEPEIIQLIDEYWETKSFLSNLKLIEEVQREKIREELGYNKYSSIYRSSNFDTKEELIEKIKINKVSTVKLDKKDIEFEVLTNSLDDIGSLVEKITNSMREKLLSE